MPRAKTFGQKAVAAVYQHCRLSRLGGRRHNHHEMLLPLATSVLSLCFAAHVPTAVVKKCRDYAAGCQQIRDAEVLPLGCQAANRHDDIFAP